MGIVIAAHQLGLDLARAEVDLPGRNIRLSGTNGVERVLPVDANGYFVVDWSMTPAHPALTRRPMHLLLAQHHDRLRGGPVATNSELAGKLVIIGSAVAGGNDLTDRGATPLLKDSLLVSKHWNVACSVLLGRFVKTFTLAEELLLIWLVGGVVAWLTLRQPVRAAGVTVGALWLAFVGLAFLLHYLQRLWLPLVVPSLAVALVHGSLVTWRVVFEQAERRRVRSVFAKIVSPNVVNELLQAEKLALGGARREVTVFFADVRGFTEFTDLSQQRTEQFVVKHGLVGQAAEDYYAEQARETLATINLYLGVVADVVKRHEGTLDKYIGDCVMAFWGAPTLNPRHASACVRAAIDAQRAIAELNRQRREQNELIEAENRTLIAAGQEPKPTLPLLSLGTGVNTGTVIVGLMGSDAHIVNYTVFGREVNLASRLETVSGRGRIIISQVTYEQLLRDDPALAAQCVQLPAVEVKGIRSAVAIYEVPWSA
jgi:adenylate cyclase